MQSDNEIKPNGKEGIINTKITKNHENLKPMAGGKKKKNNL